MAAYQAGHAWVVFLGALMAIVSLFYYLQIARAAYMDEPAAEAPPIRLDPGLEAVVLICMAMVVIMGVAPAPFLSRALDAARALLG